MTTSKNVPIKTKTDQKMNSWEEELCDIVEKNDLNSFKSVLDRVNQNGNIGRIEWKMGHDPLHLAARLGRDDMIKLFVEAGVYIDSYVVWDNGDRCTSLHMAVHQENVSTVRLLLDLGANVKLNGEMLTPFVFCLPWLCICLCSGLGEKNSGTALVWAEKTENKDVIELLQEHSASISTMSSWEADLWKAMSVIDMSTFRLILSREDVRRNGKLGRTNWHANKGPLQMAALLGRNDMIQMLVQAGVDINSYIVRDNGNKYTALHAAVKGNNLPTVRLVMSLGGDLSVEGTWDNISGTPAEWARQCGNNIEMIRLLDPNAVSEQIPLSNTRTDASAATRHSVLQLRADQLKEDQAKAAKEREKKAKEEEKFRTDVNQLMKDTLLEARGSRLERQIKKLPKAEPIYQRFKSLEKIGKIGKQVDKIEKDYEKTIKKLEK